MNILLASLMLVIIILDVCRDVLVRKRLRRLETLVTQYASIDNRNLGNQRLMNDSVIAYSQRTDVRIMNLENAVSTLAIKQGLVFGGESVRH